MTSQPLNRPVDVLAVIRLASRDYRADGHTEFANELLDVMGAVDELIESATMLLASDKRYGLGGASHDRLAASLANIGPQS